MFNYIHFSFCFTRKRYFSNKVVTGNDKWSYYQKLNWRKTYLYQNNLHHLNWNRFLWGKKAFLVFSCLTQRIFHYKQIKLGDTLVSNWLIGMMHWQNKCSLLTSWLVILLHAKTYDAIKIVNLEWEFLFHAAYILCLSLSVYHLSGQLMLSENLLKYSVNYNCYCSFMTEYTT